MFYQWHAVGPDNARPPAASGIMPGEDERPAQRAAEAFLRDGRAFAAVVAECWPGGRVWWGKRNTSGGISWYPCAPGG